MTTAEVFSLLKPGFRLDAYRIQEWRGGGAYGDVYRGGKDGRPVALKVARHRQFSADPAMTDERLLRELVCLVHLDHPHIAKVFGWGRMKDSRAYLAMEYVDGWTLAEWLQHARPTFRQVVGLFAKLAQALEYMHRRRVRHRDLSLSNLLVRKVDGEPVIIDLGAGEYSGALESTDAPLPPGTHRYRSPEAARFFKEHQHHPEARYLFPPEDDFYSLTVCLYDALTDAEPARHGDARQSPRIDVNSPTWAPPSARAANSRVPEALSGWVEKWMARDFEQRRPALAAMREALEALGAQSGLEWLAPVQPLPEASAAAPERAGRTPVGTRRRVLVAAVAATVLTAVGAVAWLQEVRAPEAPPAPAVPASSSSPTAQTPQATASATSPPPSAVPFPTPVPLVEKESPSVSTPTHPSLSPPAAKPPKKAAPAFSPQFLRDCAVATALAASQLGCPAQPIKPTRESCPAAVVETMRRIGIRDGVTPEILVDVNQPRFRSEEECTAAGRSWHRARCLVLVVDGQIESEISGNAYGLEKGSRLYGRVWTEGEKVVGRYTRIRWPDGEESEVCVSLSVGDGALKYPGSKPGAALVAPTDGVRPVYGQWP